MGKILTAILLFCFFVSGAQDITGIWRGHFRGNDYQLYQRFTGDDDRYKMEVQIAQQKKNLKAVTYSYKSTVFYGKADADGSVDFSAKKVLLRELKILEVKMVAGDACIMTCTMQYSRLGDDEFLEGTYTSMNTRDSTDCGRGSIFLHKVTSTDFYKEPFLIQREKAIAEEKSKPNEATPSEAKKEVTASAKKPATSGTNKKPVTASPKNSTAKTTKPVPVEKSATAKTTTAATAAHAAKPKATPPKPKQKDLAKVAPSHQTVEPVKRDSETVTKIDKRSLPVPIPRVLTSRSNEVVSTLAVTTPEVELNIYDDGTIDNDTVSVYFDNKPVVRNARLTDQPIVVHLHLDESSETHEVVMVAENLGDIPPNTSLMVVKAGEKRYEVRIVSDEQKNAVVIFKYQKPQ